MCLFMDKDAPIKIVCPPLVPATKYRKVAGVHGSVEGYKDPQVKAPRNLLYLVGFNAGDTGPTYWHWIAGMGTPEAIQYWVLSDVRNVVRGKPKRVPCGDGRRSAGRYLAVP